MDTIQTFLTLEEKFNRQKMAGRQKTVAIFVDIDDTWEVLLKEREKDVKYKTEYFRNKSHEAWKLASQHFFPIIAVTGRGLDAVLADQRLYIEDPAMAKPFLPFDAIYAGVGTEGYIAGLKNDSFVYIPDTGWDRKQESRFSREKIYPICKELIYQVNHSFPPDKNRQQRFVFQARDSEENVNYWNTHTVNDPAVPHEKKPQPFKISFYFTGSSKELETVEKMVSRKLAQSGYNSVNMTASYSQKYDQTDSVFNIDLTPLSKVGAIEHVCDNYSCTALFAGDSGNDFDALMKYGFAIMDPKPELIGKMKDVMIEKTTHFIAIHNLATRQTKLIYKDPTPLESSIRYSRGPEVLLDAVKAYLLIEDVNRNGV